MLYQVYQTDPGINFFPSHIGNYVPTEQKNEEKMLGKSTEVIMFTQRWIWATDIDPVLQFVFLFCFTSVNQLKLRSANMLHFPPIDKRVWFYCQ